MQPGVSETLPYTITCHSPGVSETLPYTVTCHSPGVSEGVQEESTAAAPRTNPHRLVALPVRRVWRRLWLVLQPTDPPALPHRRAPFHLRAVWPRLPDAGAPDAPHGQAPHGRVPAGQPLPACIRPGLRSVVSVALCGGGECKEGEQSASPGQSAG